MEEIAQLPDEVIETARQLLDDGETHQWVLGDYLCDVVAEFGHVMKRADIIRQLATRTGADNSTLRDRQCVAEFFPKEVRDEYPFTWSQFRAIKSAGDSWREYADWAAANLPCPVALIRERIRNNGHEAPAWVGRWERAVGLLDQIRLDKDAPERVRSASSWFLGLLLERKLMPADLAEHTSGLKTE